MSREILTRELESVGIRLNRRPPDIYFKKKKTVCAPLLKLHGHVQQA